MVVIIKSSEFVIHFFQGGLKKHVPLSRANLRIWSKIRVFLGLVKFLSAYVGRDKKKFKKWIFALTPLRELFEVNNSQF